MRLEDYQRKVYEDFIGVYRRGQEDTVPQDHFFDSLNIAHGIRQWRTRPGLSSSIFLGYQGNVRRFCMLAGILLVLDDQGNLYTYSTRSGDDATNALINVGASDFAAIRMLGKIYISFHDGQLGLSGVNLKVLIPHPSDPMLDEIRDAAGPAPIAESTIVSADGAAGIVNAGVYKIAVSYITSSGYITQPGPKIGGTFSPTIYTSPGLKAINLSNIPLGSAGTVSRQILITKAGLEEYFFVSSTLGGIINDNTTTTAVLNFDDTTDLVASADYLFDLLETIPSGVALQDYNGGLITGGEFSNSSFIRASNIGDVESFDAVDGVRGISQDDGFGVRNLLVIRNNLYIGKNLGAWSLRSNNDVLSSWGQPILLDANLAVNSHGIAEFYDSAGIRMTRDWTIICDISGLLLFNGILQKPPLTNKINDIWHSLNFNEYHKVQVIVDEKLHKIYCSLPINGATECNTLIVGDYNLCPGKIPESDKIKWGFYQFSPCNISIRPTEIGMFNFPPDDHPTFKIGSMDGNLGRIYTLDPNETTDDGADIISYWEIGPQYWEPGNVHFFTAARLRIAGSGLVTGLVYGEDNLVVGVLPSIQLSLLDFRFFAESLEGKIDGVNVTFKSCYFQISTFFFGVFQNGLLIFQGTDYTVVAGVFTMTVAPAKGDTLQFLFTLGTVPTLFAVEVPTGTIDGSNVTFTTAHTSSEYSYALIFQNGLLIPAAQYVFGGTTITMINPPLPGDTLQVAYHRDLNATGWIREDQTVNVDGSTYIFTLANQLSANFVAVFQNGLLIRKNFDYQISGNKIMFTTIPVVGDTIVFVYRSSPTGNTFGLEKLIRFNFQNEKAKLKFSMVSGQMIVNKLELFGKPTYPMRPM